MRVFIKFCIPLLFILCFLASGGQGHTGFKLGEPAKVYALESKVNLDDVNSLDKSVGYLINGDVHVSSIWENDLGYKLLKFKLELPKLNIKSRKAPTPHDFVSHTSNLDTAQNGPFYGLWKLGEMEKVYFDPKESISLVNFKKGIVSLFQFQLLDGEKNETDVSGYCRTIYTSTSPTTINKVKENCLPASRPRKDHPERLLSTSTQSKRYVEYTMSEDNSILEAVLSVESHNMKMIVKQDAGNKVDLVQKLVLYDNKVGEAETIEAKTEKLAVAELIEKGQTLIEQTLQVMKEPQQCQNDCPTLLKLIKENKDVLKSTSLGTIKSASVFIKMLNTARQSKADEIYNALKSIKNKVILQQMCDLVGFTQTIAAHQAAKKFLHFDSEYDMENTERYLWALSVGTNPQEEVVLDILKLSENKNYPAKLSETLVLTVSAMADKFAQISDYGYNHKVVEKVFNSITYYLSVCKNSECRTKYIRAMKNLQHPDIVKVLLKEALTGQKSVSVAAMKSLRAMPKSFWNEAVIKTCIKIFYQIPKRFDSSSRTLAVDIVLDSRPSEDVLKGLVEFLTTNEKEFEVKQFLYQRLLMLSDNCPKFRNTLKNIIQSNKQANNWHVLGQKGLTTAFSRSFMKNQWVNGSLVTIQEISGGVLKRGHVDVIIEADGEQKELFSLGLFAGGLSGLMGSSTSNEEDAPPDPADEGDDVARAGMELTVQGVQIRPFTFFTGQGELMGHVWAGTASDRTPAFQAVSLLHDYSEWISLGNGVTVELSLVGALSLDMAAQIQLSIWSRVAHSLVEKNAGVVIQGMMKVDNTFVKSQVEFVIATEAKLNLVSDLDFYSDVSLCMQLKQPNTVVKHNIYKIERIPGSKHKLRKSQYKTLHVPGKTYALNRKNNEMCNLIHKY